MHETNMVKIKVAEERKLKLQIKKNRNITNQKTKVPSETSGTYDQILNG